MPTATLLENIAVYDARRGHLEIELFGKWAVCYDRKLEGEYGDFQDAVAAAVSRFGR